MIISEKAIPAHTIVGALNLDTSFKIKKHIFSSLQQIKFLISQ